MRLRQFLVFLTTLAALAGCGRRAGQIAPEAPPPTNVALAVVRTVVDYVDYTGRTNAKYGVTIVPRVTGYLEKMPFKEGAEVKENDLLFVVDPRPYQAQFAAAKAQVAQNQASLDYAVATYKRFKELSEKTPGSVSQRELDQYKAQQQQAEASLDLANSNLDSAKLNLEWTKVKAPISGRISRYYLTSGNLVNQDSTQLTTIVSLDPMFVYFDMDEPTYLRLKKGKGSEGEPNKGIVLKMGLQGEDGYPHEGAVDFFDNQVNPATDSVSVRGIFVNPKTNKGDYLFSPGMFVRVRLEIGILKDALLVLDRVVISDQGRKKVFVVDQDNMVQERAVVTGPLQDDGLRVIAQGLQKEDRVVISGLQQLRPRMPINPTVVPMPTLSAPPQPEPPPGTKTDKTQKKKK